MLDINKINKLSKEELIDLLINKMHKKEINQYMMHTYGYDRMNFGYLPFFIKDLNMSDIVSCTSPFDEDITYVNDDSKNKHVALLEVEKGLVPWENMGRPQKMKKSTDLITVHDTGDVKHSAKWWNDLEKTNDEREASWNFTVGEDKIYQNIGIDEVAWHAGDGSREFSLLDTNVKFEGNNPTITLGKDHYMYLNGKKSIIEVPKIMNARDEKMNGMDATEITKAGLYTTLGDNGNYYMADIYASNYDQNLGIYYVCTKGGNRNSIGIETDIHEGVDYNKVMRHTANLVANMLVHFNLTPDRVLQHRNFSGKHCPQLMIENNLWEEFINVVECEYIIKKYLNDLDIKYESLNKDLLSNDGEVLQEVKEDINVSYNVIVKLDNISKTYTLNTLIKKRK